MEGFQKKRVTRPKKKKRAKDSISSSSLHVVARLPGRTLFSSRLAVGMWAAESTREHGGHCKRIRSPLGVPSLGLHNLFCYFFSLFR